MAEYVNFIRTPSHYDYVIMERNVSGGSRVGNIRIKPSGILWKGKGWREFRSVSWSDFEKWIESTRKAKSVKY
jgi:hypothetical protein